MTVSPVQVASRIAPPDLDVDTPALIVDETIMQRNIDEMAAFARSVGVSLRPHIKTHKTPEIARRQIAAGAIGIMCAKLGEAEVFAAAGIEDIAVGYQIVGPIKIRRVLEVMERTRLTLSLDSLEAAEALGSAIHREDRAIDVYIEVDSGHHRAGVPIGQAVIDFALSVARIPGLRLTGIMTHEGHANVQPPETIREVAIAAGQAMVDIGNRIKEAGIDLQTISVGSTPCALFTPTVEGITEMRPGTFVFRDTMGFRYGTYGPDRCAARYVAVVASRPAKDRAVLDSGAKTLSLDLSASHPGHGYIVHNPEVNIERLSEEHAVAVIPEGTPGFDVGDRVEIIPNHVCTSVNLHERMLILRDGQVVDEWKIAARGRVQ